MRVREKLWEMIESGIKTGGAIMLWSYPCPQGYKYIKCGKMKRKLQDYEGLALVRLPPKNKKS